MSSSYGLGELAAARCENKLLGTDCAMKLCRDPSVNAKASSLSRHEKDMKIRILIKFEKCNSLTTIKQKTADQLREVYQNIRRYLYLTVCRLLYRYCFSTS